MRRNTFRAPLLIVLLMAAAGATFQTRQSASRLTWLSGCWRITTPTSTIDEQWMTPAGGVMLGMSRTVRHVAGRDTVIEHEFTRIFTRGDTLIYGAMPSRQAPAEFPAERIEDSSVVFANLAHDFPQRIRYRVAGDSLHASIEGTIRGQKRLIPYPFARVACTEGKVK